MSARPRRTPARLPSVERAMTVALLALAMASPLAPSPSACAAERASVTFSTPPAGQDAGDALGALVELSGMAQSIDVDLLVGGASTRRIAISLVSASPAATRQAFAHALGCWWAPSSDGREIVYSRDAHLPLGRLYARWKTSGLIDRPDLEPLVASLLAPWVSGAAGISCQASTGLWPATLDAAGHARLIEILSLLDRPLPQCPDLVPDPDQPDLERRIETPLRADTWGELAALLSVAGHVSVALGPGLPAGGPARDAALATGSLADIRAALAAHGVRADFRHGVLCLDAADIEEREHPASRRRLALLPVAHLLRSDVDGELLAVAITRHVDPQWWTLPGAGLTWLSGSSSLLVAADAVTIHHVLDALDRIDQLGVEDGLASLAAKRDDALRVKPTGDGAGRGADADAHGIRAP